MKQGHFSLCATRDGRSAKVFLHHARLLQSLWTRSTLRAPLPPWVLYSMTVTDTKSFACHREEKTAAWKFCICDACSAHEVQSASKSPTELLSDRATASKLSSFWLSSVCVCNHSWRLWEPPSSPVSGGTTVPWTSTTAPTVRSSTPSSTTPETR